MNTTKGAARAGMLIETDELERQLDDSRLRVIDCDIMLSVKPEGGYRVESGRGNWEEEHIPNSIYIDIGKELSAKHPTLRYMLPTAEHFQHVMSEKGIGDEHDVVLYARGANYWATRLYLMFREFGFERVRVLNGAFDKWLSEGRPVTRDVPSWPSAQFTAADPAGSFVDKAAVQAVLGNDDVCLINALPRAIHSGESFNPPYGRPGHISGSVNVPFATLIDPETNRFLNDDALRQRFDAHEALGADRLIAYCGGGISATTVAFALRLLGRDDVAVYDGSLSEWGNDPELPMSTAT
ncbi:MAG: sulfurtransferase [Pseudomonadota bacterium]